MADIFVGWSIGKGTVSRAIQRHSKDELCLFKDTKLIRPDRESQIATHVFALYKNKVFESHFCVEKNGLARTGVMEWTFDNWLKYSNKNNQFFYFPYAGLSLELLEFWVRNNPGYGKMNIAQLLARDLFDKFLTLPLSDSRDKDKGLICSEYLAICDESQEILRFGEKNSNEFIMLKPHLIKPIHWQAWAYNNCPEKIIKGNG